MTDSVHPDRPSDSVVSAAAPKWPYGQAEQAEHVLARFKELLDLQEQHGNAYGALMFLTGLTFDEIENLGGVPDGEC